MILRPTRLVDLRWVGSDRLPNGHSCGPPILIYPHMLRQACGYALANNGHDPRAIQAWMWHKNIQHSVRHTELALLRWAGAWIAREFEPYSTTKANV